MKWDERFPETAAVLRDLLASNMISELAYYRIIEKLAVANESIEEEN